METFLKFSLNRWIELVEQIRQTYSPAYNEFKFKLDMEEYFILRKVVLERKESGRGVLLLNLSIVNQTEVCLIKRA